MELSIVIAILTIVILLFFVIGIYIYFRFFQNDKPISYIVNPEYKTYQELVLDEQSRSAYDLLVPVFMSKDVYKNDPNKYTAIQKDYSYLLNNAVQCYNANQKEAVILANILKDVTASKEAHIPLLVFSKYTVDYDVYLRDMNLKDLKTSASLKTIEYCEKLSGTYMQNKTKYNNHLFYTLKNENVYAAKYSIPQAIESKCPTLVGVQQEQKTKIDYCAYFKTDKYEKMSVDEKIKALVSDYKFLLTEALNVFDTNITKDIAEKDEKYMPILAFINFGYTYGAKYKNIVPQSDIENINVMSESVNQTAFEFIQDLAMSYLMDQQRVSDIIDKTCKSQQTTTSITTATTQSYVLLSSEQRNQTILQDSIELLKTAVNSIISNKQELYKVYQQRKSDNEFLSIYSFVPVLMYVKYIEDNKQTLNQIDPLVRQNALDKALPNFQTDPQYYVQDLHAQVFIIIASNLYTLSPSSVNKAILIS